MRRLSIIGNLTHDATIKEVNNNRAINFSVAVNEKFRNKDGQDVEKTYYYNCTIWRSKESSIAVANFLTKGTKVLVEGLPEARNYTKDGAVVSYIDINVKELEFLGGGNKDNGNTNSGRQQEISSFNSPMTEFPEDNFNH